MKGVKFDAKTGKKELITDSTPFPEYPPASESEPVNFGDLRKLIKYAKNKGWI